MTDKNTIINNVLTRVETDKRATEQKKQLIKDYIEIMKPLNKKQFNINVSQVKNDNFHAYLTCETFSDNYAKYKLHIVPLNNEGFTDWARPRVELYYYCHDIGKALTYIPTDKKTPYFSYDNLLMFLLGELVNLDEHMKQLNNINADMLNNLINDYEHIKNSIDELRNAQTYFDNNGSLFNALGFYNFYNIL